MRTLSAALKAAQASGAVAGNYKAVINGVTYDESRILHLLHDEATGGAIADIILDNSDGTLDALNVKGLRVNISYGVDSEFSDAAPLWVMQQHEDTYARRKVLVLRCEGMVNWLIRDEASAEFLPEPADTTVLRTYLQHILTATAATDLPVWVAGSTRGTADYIAPTPANGWYYKCSVAGTAGSAEPTWPTGLKTTVADSAVTWTAWGRAATVYSHAPAYALTIDSAEGLLTAFAPADAFYVHRRDSRWLSTKRLLDYTESVILPQADTALHVIRPTVSGTAYDYTYDNSSATTHNFWKKEYSQRLVAPNYLTLESMADDAVVISQTAANTADNALYNVRTFKDSYLVSTALASSAASASITKLNMSTDKGRLLAPMNVGQEVYDYVNVVDADGNSVTGNVSSVMRRCAPGVFDMELRLGGGSLIRPLPALPEHISENNRFVEFLPWFVQTFVPRLDAILERMAQDHEMHDVRVESHAGLTTRAHGGTAPLIIVKPADQTVNNSTALVNDNVLAVPLAASAAYALEFRGVYQSNTAAGIKWGWNYPVNADINWAWIGTNTADTKTQENDLDQTAVQSAIGKSGGSILVALTDVITGVVRNGATAGTLSVRWAQNVAHTTNTQVLKGSCLRAYKLNL